MRRRRKIFGWGLLALASLTVSLAAAQQRANERPSPDRVNVSYGSHHRNRLDFWSAPSDQPTPLVVYFHGGGFRGGDKKGVPPALLRRCLDGGISVASINYRLSQHAPFPAPMLDSARAIQFLRSKAEDWNIDADRIAASGSSAGGGIALWVGFRDDLVNPQSDDPIERESSRLAAMAVFGAQTTYDPRVIARIVGGRAHEHPALLPFFGLDPSEFETEAADSLFRNASPDSYLSPDDPPVLLVYNEPRGPLSGEDRPGKGIHHPNFGEYLRAKMRTMEVDCQLIHVDDLEGGDSAADALIADELLRQLDYSNSGAWEGD